MTSPRVETAQALVAAGRTRDALALLESSDAAGDVDALMQAVVLYLTGSGVPRDVDRARALLRRAVTIGHVDGALMEIALTANGGGGQAESDWATAASLLRRAAAHDHVAQAQLTLLETMTIDAAGRPVSEAASRPLNDTPAVRYFPGLLTRAECQHVATVASDMLEPALIIDPVTGQRRPNPIRTSDGAAIGPTREDLVVRAINHRLARASGTAIDQGEPLTVLRYRPGQEYRPHVDTIAGERNQRTKTMIIYLNEGFVGGDTTFPTLGLSIRPRGGDALLFDNVLADGRPDPRSVHAGSPVRQGVKWIATRWIRAEAISPWDIASSR